MTRPVVLREYDARWPAMFDRERARLVEALSPYVLAVEHIGSTAVAGLAGKATIDILAGIYRLADAPRCVERMAKLGYEYVGEFEKQLPERRYFRLRARAGPEAEDEFHVHMVEVESPFWERHLLFRDFLRAHPEAVREYEALKEELVSAHGERREAYTEGKTAFIRRIEEEARAERAKRGAARPGPAGAEAPPRA